MSDTADTAEFPNDRQRHLGMQFGLTPRKGETTRLFGCRVMAEVYQVFPEVDDPPTKRQLRACRLLGIDPEGHSKQSLNPILGAAIAESVDRALQMGVKFGTVIEHPERCRLFVTHVTGSSLRSRVKTQIHGRARSGPTLPLWEVGLCTVVDE